MCGRPEGKVEAEKEWETKMVWEVSKKSRGQEEGEAGKFEGDKKVWEAEKVGQPK